MKKLKLFALTVVPLFAFMGCTTDVAMKSLDVTWDQSNKKAVVKISNIGIKPVGKFFVYFNVKEDPESQNHIPQVNEIVSGLARGESVTLTADFAPLAHPDNDSLKNVKKIIVMADAKGMINEFNENNNTKEKLIP